MSVHVFFHGLCMWWLASQPAMVLIPDLTQATVAHTAVLSAPPSAFSGGVCPLGFVQGGTTTAPTCDLALNGAGKPGGVRIAFQGGVMVAPLEGDPFCALPKIQHDQPLVLAPEYAPPLGAQLAATMTVSGGKPQSGMTACTELPQGNCPRYVQWDVPAASDGTVTLVLDNLTSNGSLQVQLAPEATVTIRNSPLDDIAQAGVRTGKRPAGSSAHATAAHGMGVNSAWDWCFYYGMLQFADSPGKPICPGLPLIPPVACVTGGTGSPRDGYTRPFRNIGTIACSNSQYP